MNRCVRLIIIIAVDISLTACAQRNTNIDQALVAQIVQEFTDERAFYYLRGGAPKSNTEIFEKILNRHAVRFAEFRPALSRYFPEIQQRILPKS
ncbi:MAG: hypothetical protein JSR44_03015 [Spirochaetes bacterium]|nr:hypothetical protein [Spirochaetota bacterium]